MIRSLFDNPVLLKLFPDIIPIESERGKKYRWSEERVCLKRSEAFPEPTYTAAGVGKALTSRHYNVIVPDDILTASLDQFTQEEIRPSAMDAAKVIGWDQVQLNGLLDMKPMHYGNPEVLYGPQILSLNNRWGDSDYVDYIERMRPEYKKLLIPIIWPQDHPDETKRGQPVWPDGPYGTLEEIAALEATMSTYIYSTQMLCNPSDSKEQVFRSNMLRYYSITPDLVDIVATMDLALSIDKGACYTAVIVVGQDAEGNWYILDAIRDHIDTDGQLNMFFEMCEKWKPSNFAMEKVLFQAKMLDIVMKDPRYANLQNWGTVFYGIEPYRGEAKDQRIEAMQPHFRRGQVYLREDQIELKNELLKYKRKTAAIVDLVDALSYIPRVLKPIDGVRVKKSYKLDDEFEQGFDFEEIENAMLTSDTNSVFGDYTVIDTPDSFNNYSRMDWN